MKIKGLKKLNTETIEQLAENWLTYCNYTALEHRRPTNLIEMAKFLTQKHQVTFNFASIIGFAEDGTKILGAFNPKKRLILIDQSLATDPSKFNFTLAHEIAHLVLHRKLKIKYDTPEELMGANSLEFLEATYTDGDWMEWQANRFAAALLMPRKVVKAQLAFAKSTVSNTSRPDHLYINKHPQSVSDYFVIIDNMAGFFGVSHTSLKIRLSALEMITDFRDQTPYYFNEARYVDWKYIPDEEEDFSEDVPF
ncbi:MAG: ImmA/IrrE family metallo-endopeptidase [Bacteroidetes bacterium]|nr:ImmA/IrrE family metallo-endopeptidase [Bacteroidota bacterium]